MVIDTSALIAILETEPEANQFAEFIREDAIRLVSAVTVLETALVIEARRGPAAGGHLDLLLHQLNANVVPFDAAQSRIARRAWSKFGKGNHSAKLNFGDCCSYALAKSSGEPLLFKGNDFVKTDLPSVC